MAWTQADLDALDTTIKAKITGGAIAAYSIAGRNLQHVSFSELVQLRREVSEWVRDGEASSDFVLADLRPR